MSEWTQDVIRRMRTMRDASAAAAFGATSSLVDLPVYGGLAANYAGRRVGLVSDKQYASNYEALRKYELNPSSSMINHPALKAIDQYRNQVKRDYPGTYNVSQYVGPGLAAKLLTKTIRRGGRRAFAAPLQMGKFRNKYTPAAIATGGVSVGEGFEALTDLFVKK